MNRITRRLGLMILLSLLLVTGCGKKSKDETGNSIVDFRTTGGTSVTSTTEYTPETDAEPETVEVKAYFEEVSDLIAVIPAEKSKDVPTEKEAESDLEKRGFDTYVVTYNYSMDGSYLGKEDIQKAGKEKHPIYSTYHVTENGDIWVIYVVNGSTFAYPYTYNLNHMDLVPVMVTETDHIMSYDSATNSFYETVPKASELLVIHVKKVDARTLESLTEKELDNK